MNGYKGAPHDGIDNDGRTAIMKAAAHGHYETFELLYHKGILLLIIIITIIIIIIIIIIYIITVNYRYNCI